jgi:hypothetical protein
MNLPTTLGEAILLIKRLMKKNARLRAIITQQAQKLAALKAMTE